MRRSSVTTSRIVPVAAGVLTDASGRVLLARRISGRDLAGAWEFPGGKIERHETAEEALKRELKEELGIEVLATEPLMSVPQHTGNKSIKLDVFKVTKYNGQPRGMENQALAWVPNNKLTSYPMPPADMPVVAALQKPAHYLITPEPTTDTTRFLRELDAALATGYRLVQLRAKSWQEKPLKALLTLTSALCKKHKAQLLINGQLGLAHDFDVGLHLSSEQLMALQARPLAARLPVAASCHNLEQLKHAQALGLDFVVLGSVNKTASHPDVTPLGWKAWQEMRAEVSLPIFAIGGLGPNDVGVARQHGAQGVAGIGAFWPNLG
jgi:8-oxo-dGTP diphosphatase